MTISSHYFASPGNTFCYLRHDCVLGCECLQDKLSERWRRLLEQVIELSAPPQCWHITRWKYPDLTAKTLFNINKAMHANAHQWGTLCGATGVLPCYKTTFLWRKVSTVILVEWRPLVLCHAYRQTFQPYRWRLSSSHVSVWWHLTSELPSDFCQRRQTEEGGGCGHLNSDRSMLRLRTQVWKWERAGGLAGSMRSNI